MMQIHSVQCVKCHWRLLHDTAVTQPATEMEGRPLHVTCHKKKNNIRKPAYNSIKK